MNNFKENEILKVKMRGEFASESWQEIPVGNINKVVTGCGLTTLALENQEDVIIAVPKITLIHNKVSQYPNKRCNYKLLGVMGGVIKEDIDEYISWCNENEQPIKIMTTYDGIWKLEDLIGKCKLIVDESQMVTKTLRNLERRDNILKLIEIIKANPDKVSLISATPLDPKYTKWASGLRRIELEWENVSHIKPIEIKSGNPVRYLKKRIIRNIEDKGYYYILGEKVRKVIIFLNSVRQIAKLIREEELNPEECSIICGDSVENQMKLSKNGSRMNIKNYEIGDKFKYLFVTSSGFEGIDIYDRDALTVVVSHTGSNYTYLDMFSDLRQAASRNRDKMNRFYGTFLFVYNQSFLEDSEEEIRKEILSTEAEIKRYVEIANESIIKDDILREGKVLLSNNLVNNFVSICPITKEHTFLEDVMESAKYEIFEVRRQYTEGFKISDVMRVKLKVDEGKFDKEVSYRDIAIYFKDNHKNGEIDWSYYSNYTEWTDIVEESYRLSKRVVENISIARDIIDANGDEFKNLIIEVRKAFKVGRYTNKEIRNTLNKIYKDAGLDRKAKPNDLYEFFGNGKIRAFKCKGERGMEILRK